MKMASEGYLRSADDVM